MIALTTVFAQRPDLKALADEGMATVIGYVLKLEQERDEARAKLKTRSPIGDSRTTHAPPSSDPRGKRRSQRRRTGRKPGAQVGHPGHRLEPVATPDRVIDHPVTTCSHCRGDLSGISPTGWTSHQVFDLPKIKLEVTEHRCESKDCPQCQHTTMAQPPTGVEQPTQYGLRIAGLAVHLHVGHFVPVQRTAEIIETLTGHRVSDGWIMDCKRRTSKRLTPFVEAVTALLRAAKVICCDETGFRFGGKRFWLHVCATALYTLFLCHRRRGSDANVDMGVLKGYQGCVVHDHWPAYYMFNDCTHAACNEHHVRELDGVVARENARWALRLKIVLYDGLNLKRQYHDNGLLIPQAKIDTITRRYRKWISAGYASTPEPIQRSGKRGRPKRGKTLALLDRLRDRESETLRFLHDPAVPWSNNQAERDIRSSKIQQKVSGGFRSESGAVEFCRIRSYLSTARKHGIHPFDAVAAVLRGDPWMPGMECRVSRQTKSTAA